MELRYQFDDLADIIKLAQSKRAWLLTQGRFSLTSNRPPDMEDLWCADVASPSLFRRPRPQDFDPDPAEQRKRPPLPDHIRTDHRSIPNMLARLRAEGLKARVELAGDPVYECADLAVDVRVTGKSRFVLRGRMEHGLTTWKLSWGATPASLGGGNKGSR